jgi:hypothetical protein
LGLEPIESGFDSLEIRIWLDYSMAWDKPLIILTRKNGEWNGRFIEDWSPETTEANNGGSKKMVQILLLLEREFDFKRTQL